MWLTLPGMALQCRAASAVAGFANNLVAPDAAASTPVPPPATSGGTPAPNASSTGSGTSSAPQTQAPAADPSAPPPAPPTLVSPTISGKSLVYGNSFTYGNDPYYTGYSTVQPPSAPTPSYPTYPNPAAMQRAGMTPDQINAALPGPAKMRRLLLLQEPPLVRLLLPRRLRLQRLLKRLLCPLRLRQSQALPF